MAKNVQFRTVTGQRGSVLILDELGYNYRKMSTSTKTGTILWRCCKCNVLNCPALVRTSGDFIILQKNHHNHQSFANKSYIVAGCTYIQKSNGALIIVDSNGFKYNKHKDLMIGESWRCSKRQSKKCGTKLFVNGDLIQLQCGPHNHDP